MRRMATGLVLATVAAGAAVPAAGHPGFAPGPGHTRASLCAVIEASAMARDLPIEFLTRLISRESAFRPTAVSHKGAQGIAQFMPATAAERGLDDPFDPNAAIPAAAALLDDLRDAFGNLGLAAAAYNAGSTRVQAFLDGGGLPGETRAYVMAITGRPVEAWRPEAIAAAAAIEAAATTEVAAATQAAAALAPDAPASPAAPPIFAPPGFAVQSFAVPGSPPAAAPPPPSCTELAALLAARGDGAGLADVVEATENYAPWGVQVAGHASRAMALALFARLQRAQAAILGDRRPMVIAARIGGRGTRAFYRVRIGEESRAAANALCRRLKDAGQACIVLKTP